MFAMFVVGGECDSEAVALVAWRGKTSKSEAVNTRAGIFRVNPLSNKSQRREENIRNCKLAKQKTDDDSSYDGACGGEALVLPISYVTPIAQI
jgi:hypothetical protein